MPSPIRYAASAFAIGAALNIASPQLAQAALSCSGTGLTAVGSWTCTETAGLPLSRVDSTVQLSLDLWNPSLVNGFTGLGLNWTLGQVSWSAAGSMSATGLVSNNTVGSSKITIAATEQFSFSAGVGAPSDFLPNPILVSGTSATQTVSVASGATVPIAPINLNLGPVTGVINSPVAAWIGAGSFSETISTVSLLNLTVAGNNNTGISVETKVSPSITLTYSGYSTAQAVPEPETYALMLAGLGAMAVMVRRRNG